MLQNFVSELSKYCVSWPLTLSSQGELLRRLVWQIAAMQSARPQLATQLPGRLQSARLPYAFVNDELCAGRQSNCLLSVPPAQKHLETASGQKNEDSASAIITACTPVAAGCCAPAVVWTIARRAECSKSPIVCLAPEASCSPDYALNEALRQAVARERHCFHSLVLQ